uniref:non-ribosomal peptide synthetase n=1 Tax=Photorhabdus sp. RM322S TaxID=3342825 RepID=UPI0036DA17BA
AALKQLSQQHGVTLFMTVLSAWGIVLSRLSSQDDIIIGTPTAGRSRQEVEPLIGFFVNTLALRMALSGELTVAECLSRVRETALAAQAHQDLPFEQVVEIVQPPRQLAHTPLFQVMFAWQNNEHADLELPDLIVSHVDQTLDIIRFDLELNLFEEADCIVGDLGYSAALFDRSTIERQVDYLHAVLQAMVDNAQQKVGEIEILAPAERRLLLERWNITTTPYPDVLCIHQLFEQQAAKTPDATALVYESQHLSYAELNVRANRLAHQLIALGVEPDQLIASCVTRSSSMVIGMLAILKAGGTYVPLDPTYPSERLAHIFNDADPAIVLVDETGREVLGEQALTGQTVLDPNSGFNQPDRNPQIATLTSRHLAYVIYTSGSTGMPKGVMVEHRGLCSVISTQQDKLAITPDSRTLQFASNSFDASIWECCLTLLVGATLYLPRATDILPSAALAGYLVDNAISHILFLPPTVLMAMHELPDTVKTLLVAGEACSTTLVKRWAVGRQMFNAYGPTETTICATLYACDSRDENTPPIGQPVANTQIYLLDAYGQPVPAGVMGEIYIGGVGVARGYLNQPELTAERFLIDPFSDDPNARLYRSGDLARYRPDGNLEFLGRNDQQVKIRGFRIEPGEIETRLMEHPIVRESVVLVHGDGLEKRLVAYVVADEDEGLANSLREHLSVVLPEYMVPAAFVRLDSFPLTPNGKLDRKALPVPGEDAFARQKYADPQGETEITLAVVWHELLGI